MKFGWQLPTSHKIRFSHCTPKSVDWRGLADLQWKRIMGQWQMTRNQLLASGDVWQSYKLVLCIMIQVLVYARLICSAGGGVDCSASCDEVQAGDPDRTREGDGNQKRTWQNDVKFSLDIGKDRFSWLKSKSFDINSMKQWHPECTMQDWAWEDGNGYRDCIMMKAQKQHLWQMK